MYNNEQPKIKKVILIFGKYGCEDFKVAAQLARHFGLYEVKNMTDAEPTEETKDLFRFMSKREVRKLGTYTQRQYNGNRYNLAYSDFKEDVINVAAVQAGTINMFDNDPYFDIFPVYIERDSKIRLMHLIQTSDLSAEEICANFTSDSGPYNGYEDAIDYSITIHNFRELIENEELLDFIGVNKNE